MAKLVQEARKPDGPWLALDPIDAAADRVLAEHALAGSEATRSTAVALFCRPLAEEARRHPARGPAGSRVGGWGRRRARAASQTAPASVVSRAHPPRGRGSAPLAKRAGLEHLSNMRYAELATTTNFTFLTGASHPEEMVERAAELGLGAIAITDRMSLAGVVRAHVRLRELAREEVARRAPNITGRDVIGACQAHPLADPHRPVLASRRTPARDRRARTHGVPLDPAADRRQPAGLRGRGVRADRPRDRPRGLWAALPAADPRQAARGEGRLPAAARGSGGMGHRPDRAPDAARSAGP